MKSFVWLVVSLLLAGCADEGAKLAGENGGEFNNGGNNNTAGGGAGQTPEIEDEFDFAEPAAVGTHVFVANETLNSVAVIDSRSLAIRTVPVGFKPSVVVGPSVADDNSRIFVLNEGSSSVSVIEPGSLQTETVPVLRRANALATNANATWAITWFDNTKLEDGGTAGDLSAATVVTADGAAFEIAVGFRIERVMFIDDGSAALVLSDDGVSAVRAAELTGDTVVPPVATLPAELQAFDRTDREVVLDPDGEWAIARISTMDGIVLTELATGVQWQVPLPARPTDLDWVAGQPGRLLGMLPEIDHAFVATVPDGLIALADTVTTPADMGSADMDSADMGSTDIGSADMGSSDLGNMDMAAADGGLDTGLTDASADLGGGVDLPTMPVTGFNYIQLDQFGLGAAEVAPNAANALLFSTVGGRKAATLLDLDTLEQRSLAFEKGVRGALSDDGGTSYIVLHDREEADIPAGTNPSDPAYIARSWGISIVDVTSAATRLVLTERKPGDVILARTDASARLFMIFEPGVQPGDSARDVLRVDLTSFSTETFRVPSLPEGLGRVDEAERVFVNQQHPQGRITFVELTSDRRQTVTGFQLNAGID